VAGILVVRLVAARIPVLPPGFVVFFDRFSFITRGPLAEPCRYHRKLRRRRFRGHQFWPEGFCIGVLLAVPADVLACYADTGRFTMECVQRREVFKDDVSHPGSQELTRHTAIFEKSIDFTEEPWRTVRAATDHHRRCAREITHTLRFFSAVNI